MPNPPFEDELAAIKQAARRLTTELSILEERIRVLEFRPADEPRRHAESLGGETTTVEVKPPLDAPRVPAAPLVIPPPVWPERARGRALTDDAATVERDVEQVIGQTWLNRIGAVILLLALIFFVKYSFDQGWLSPTTRVVIGGVFGLMLVGVGEFSLFRGMRTFAGGVLGCGIGVLYLSAFGSYNFYHLVEAETAFVLYCGVTALSVAVSVHGRLLPVAVLGIIGGFITPIALDTGANRQVALLTYVLLLDLGFLALAAYRRWDAVRVLSWLGTVLLFGGWYSNHYDEIAMWRTAGFVLAFYLLFHGEGLWSAYRRAVREPKALAAMVHANNVAFFASIYFLLRNAAPEWMGLFAVSVAAMQWLAAWRLLGDCADIGPVRSALWQDGAAMLGLAAPMQFDRYLVSVSWSVQAAVTFWFCRRSPHFWLRVKGAAIVLAAAMHLILFDRPDPQLFTVVWSAGRVTFAWILPCFVLLGLCCYAGGAFLVVRRVRSSVDGELSASLMVVGSLLILGIFADQWERYLATWAWLGLATAWWLVARRTTAAAGMVAAIGLAACAKFLVADTVVAAATGAWQNLSGIVFNRAVVTGLLLTGFIALARNTVVDGLKRWADEPVIHRGIDATAVVLALVLLTWTGTFEIARVFRFEEFRFRFADPTLAMHLFITVFWSVNATSVLAGGFLRRRKELRYLSILLFAATVVKVFLYDMSHLEMGYRIIAFFVLGVLLLFASLLYQRRFTSPRSDNHPA